MGDGMRHYRTICVDPPWDYKRDKGYCGGNNWVKAGKNYTVKPSYTLMTLAELERFGEVVNAMADPNGAAIFCWTTNAFLHDAFHLLDAWGWPSQKAVGIWVKSENGAGMGHWVRNDLEYWLWAVRGDIKCPDHAETNLIRAGTNGHSVKPQAFYDMVERISPGPYLDLFGGRGTLRFNWDAWGDGR
jgi:N6-adenosine-specific RNA methylase IME4